MESVVPPVGEALMTTSEKTKETFEKEEDEETKESVKESTSRNKYRRHSSSDVDLRYKDR